MIFKDNPYYHATIKNLIVAFGTLFSDLTIVHKDDAGTRQKVIKVPITYGPKNKWIARLKEQPNPAGGGVQISLPRMAFEITDYKYDPTRKIGTHGSHVTGTLGSNRAKLYNPVPYDVAINLYTLAKDQDDSLKILEQILPYFSPQVMLNIEVIPEFKITKDIPIVLGQVSVDDTYEGSPEQMRTVTQTFQFVAKLDLYGPIQTSNKYIKIAKADMSGAVESQYTASVNPLSANKDDVFTIDETWSI